MNTLCFPAHQPSTHMPAHLAWVLCGIFLFTGSLVGAEITGWPNWRGAGCNGSASETGIDYVDSLKDAKLLWTSEALVYRHLCRLLHGP